MHCARCVGIPLTIQRRRRNCTDLQCPLLASLCALASYTFAQRVPNAVRPFVSPAREICYPASKRITPRPNTDSISFLLVRNQVRFSPFETLPGHLSAMRAFREFRSPAAMEDGQALWHADTRLSVEQETPVMEMPDRRLFVRPYRGFAASIPRFRSFYTEVLILVYRGFYPCIPWFLHASPAVSAKDRPTTSSSPARDGDLNSKIS